MSAWGCPHEIDGKCARINDLPCEPGMKGCVLSGRFVWADESKNRPHTPKADEAATPPRSDNNCNQQ